MAEVARTLEKDKECTTLDLTGSAVGHQCAPLLRDVLVLKSSAITALTLYQCQLGDEGAATICSALDAKSGITALDISFNSMGPTGASALALALQSTSSLTELAASGNPIGDQGCTVLSEGLSGNMTLRSLELHDNGIGATGCAALARALSAHATLTRLGLGANKVGDNGAADLGAALQANSSLLNLDLSRNSIGATGGASLCTALEANTDLRVMLLAHNALGSEVRERPDLAWPSAKGQESPHLAPHETQNRTDLAGGREGLQRASSEQKPLLPWARLEWHRGGVSPCSRICPNIITSYAPRACKVVGCGWVWLGWRGVRHI